MFPASSSVTSPLVALATSKEPGASPSEAGEITSPTSSLVPSSCGGGGGGGLEGGASSGGGATESGTMSTIGVSIRADDPGGVTERSRGALVSAPGAGSARTLPPSLVPPSFD